MLVYNISLSPLPRMWGKELAGAWARVRALTELLAATSVCPGDRLAGGAVPHALAGRTFALGLDARGPQFSCPLSPLGPSRGCGLTDEYNAQVGSKEATSREVSRPLA